MFWGNEQVAKRIEEFFLCVSCIVLPVLAVLLLLDFKASLMKLSSLPDLQQTVMPDYSLVFLEVIVGAYFLLSYLAVFASMFKSHWMTDGYVKL